MGNCPEQIRSLIIRAENTPCTTTVQLSLYHSCVIQKVPSFCDNYRQCRKQTALPGRPIAFFAGKAGKLSFGLLRQLFFKALSGTCINLENCPHKCMPQIRSARCNGMTTVQLSLYHSCVVQKVPSFTTIIVNVANRRHFRAAL